MREVEVPGPGGLTNMHFTAEKTAFNTHSITRGELLIELEAEG